MTGSIKKKVNVKPRVLIVYDELLDYRLPIFSFLGKAFDLTVSHSGVQKTDGSAGFKEIVLPRYKLWRFHFQSGLHRLIRNGNFDVVFYFMDIAWVTTVVNFLLPRPSIRKVTWGLWRTGRSLPDAMRLWLAKQADHNVFYSRSAAEDFVICGLSRERVSVARNTILVHNPTRNENTYRDTILVVGSFSRRKQNDVTIKAFVAVAQEVATPVKLVFVGAGSDLDRVKSLAEESSLANRIEFHPACHDEEILRGFYNHAICSVSHGQAGLSVLQSFAYGVPFVTRADAISGGEIENIENGLNGILTSGSQRELEDALRRLITNPRDAESMGLEALKHYQNRANITCMSAGFIESIEPVSRSG